MQKAEANSECASEEKKKWEIIQTLLGNYRYEKEGMEGGIVCTYRKTQSDVPETH